MFKSYLDQFGMKIDDKLTYNDFVNIIKYNKKMNNFGENEGNNGKSFNTFETFQNINNDLYEDNK